MRAPIVLLTPFLRGRRLFVSAAVVLILLLLPAGLGAESPDILPVAYRSDLEQMRPLSPLWEVTRDDGERWILKTGDLIPSPAGRAEFEYTQRARVVFNPQFRYVGRIDLYVQDLPEFRLLFNGEVAGAYDPEDAAESGGGISLTRVTLPRRLFRWEEPNDIVIEVVNAPADGSAIVSDALLVRENALSNHTSTGRLSFFNGQLYTFFSLFMVYYTFLYYLVHRREGFYLFLGLANLGFAIYFYRMSFMPIVLSHDLSFKVSKAVLPLAVSFIALALTRYFRFYDRRRVRGSLLLLGAVLSLAILVLGGADESGVYRVFSRVMFGVIPLVIFTLVVTVRSWRAGNPDARIVLTGFVVAALFGLHDLLFVVAQSIDALDPYYFAPVIWLQGIGLFVFNLTIFTSLALRTIRSRTELERYTSNVEELVAERTAELDSATAQARAANRAKSDFLANVSHEMRTPLNAIMGFGEALCDVVPTGEHREYAELVVEESQRLTELIDQLLDLSKIEAGRFDLVEEVFDLPALISSVREILQSKAVKRGIELELACDERLPHLVLGDGLRLRQVFINLVDNGIKFTDAGWVRLKAELLSTEDDAYLIAFTVADSGVGIDKEHLERLFDKFYQVERGRTRRDSGFGLGTAISKLIIERMGGTIEVRSTPGEGTTFIVRISLRGAADDYNGARVLVDHPEVGSLPEGCRVLIVDDYPTNRKMVEYHLTSAGCTAVCAEDGLTAIELATRDRFDCILMDIFMPGMDGLETCRRIREAGISVPIVALTANAYNQDFAGYWEAGMNDILIKPFRRSELLDLIIRCTTAGSGSPPRTGADSERGKGDSELDLDLLSLDFDGNEAMLSDILTGFLLDVRERLPLIREGILDGDSELVHRESHAIKGGARNIRAEDLAAAAERLEQKARAGLAYECLPQLEELERFFRRVAVRIEEADQLQT